MNLDHVFAREDLDEFTRKAFFAVVRGHANPQQAQRVIKFILGDICKIGALPQANWTAEQRAFHGGLLYVAYSIQSLANLGLWAETTTEETDE